MKNRKKTLLICGIVCGLLAMVLVVVLSVTNKKKDNPYEINTLSKEEVFQVLYENQKEFEMLVKHMEEILSESGKRALSLRGESDYKKNSLEGNLLAKYPIEIIAVNDIDAPLNVTFDFDVKSNRVMGIYYTSENEPLFWGEDKGIEELDGIYTKKGPYYIYETEKILEHWYYFNVSMW